MSRKILFIQHAGGLGGSAYSLLYTLQGLREAGDECVVLLARPTADLGQLYRDAGFEVIADEPFALIDHSTVAVRPLWRLQTYTELTRAFVGARSVKQRLTAILGRTGCNLVHLNSMPLVPLAHELNSMRVPYAWHVREPPPNQGLRTNLIRNVMRNCDGMIFLSHFDRTQWMGSDQGTVVNNFVPQRFFDPPMSRLEARASLGIQPEEVAALFLGGAHPAKGGDVLLRAMASPLLRAEKIHWVIPNAMPPAPQRTVSRIARRVLALVGSGPRSVRFFNGLTRLTGVRVSLTNFQTDVLPYFVASDIVLFPATSPHFARPAIEAAAVGRATIASRIGGVDELVIDRTTGLLVPPGDAAALANAIHQLVQSPRLRDDMGTAGKQLATERFDLRHQIGKIRAVHDALTNASRDRSCSFTEA